MLFRSEKATVIGICLSMPHPHTIPCLTYLELRKTHLCQLYLEMITLSDVTNSFGIKTYTNFLLRNQCTCTTYILIASAYFSISPMLSHLEKEFALAIHLFSQVNLATPSSSTLSLAPPLSITSEKAHLH